MNVQFETFGTRHRRNDGGEIILGPGIIDATADLRIAHKDDGGDLPTDVLALDCFVADENGEVWKTTSTFTAEIIIANMINIAEDGDGAPRRITDEMAQFQGEPFLPDVNFSSDDRMYRPVLIDETNYCVQFKYSTVVMDLFDINPYGESEPLLSSLGVRVTDGMFDHEKGPVGTFGFRVRFHHLLRSNTAIFCEDYGRHMDSPFPLPLTFEWVGDDGTRQEEVKSVSIAV